MFRLFKTSRAALAAAGAIVLAAAFSTLPLPLLVAPALAQAAAAAAPDTAVHFDLGAILSPILQIAGTGLAVVAAWAVSKTPAFVQALLTEQTLKRAIDYATATVSGAVAGKEVSIPIANEIIRVAAQYVADNAPKLTAALGATLGPKLIARLGDAVVLPPDASAAKLLHNPEPAS